MLNHPRKFASESRSFARTVRTATETPPSVVSTHLAGVGASETSERVGALDHLVARADYLDVRRRLVQQPQLVVERGLALGPSHALQVLERRAEPPRDLRRLRAGDPDLVEGEADVAVPRPDGLHEADYAGLVAV